MIYIKLSISLLELVRFFCEHFLKKSLVFFFYTNNNGEFIYGAQIFLQKRKSEKISMLLVYRILYFSTSRTMLKSILVSRFSSKVNP